MAANLPDDNKASPICTKVLIVDTECHIRHGAALTMRGVCWLVTEKTVGQPLLGRAILEMLGLNSRSILAAAAENRSGVVDVHQLLNQPYEMKMKCRDFFKECIIPMEAYMTQALMMTTDGLTSDLRIYLRKRKSSIRRSAKLALAICPRKDLISRTFWLNSTTLSIRSWTVGNLPTLLHLR